MTKIVKVGVRKEEGKSYVVDNHGDVSCYRNMYPEILEKVAKVGIKREPGKYYYIDENGDISVRVLTQAEENALAESEKKKLLEVEVQKIKNRKAKLNRRIEAEKIVYGKEKDKRTILNEDEKNVIFHKFNYECAVCGMKEGLHIHHKDKNPSNNRIQNLIVLCGVCHKKIHMNVR